MVHEPLCAARGASTRESPLPRTGTGKRTFSQGVTSVAEGYRPELAVGNLVPRRVGFASPAMTVPRTPEKDPPTNRSSNGGPRYPVRSTSPAHTHRQSAGCRNREPLASKLTVYRPHQRPTPP